MKFRFEIGLDDIGIGLDMMSNSEEEREEVMDFITHLDESMADADFTCNLVYRLSVAISHDTEVRGWEMMTVPGIQESRQVTFDQLYRGLSYMDEDKLIALLANAMRVRRERDAKAAAEAMLCLSCEHPMGVHNMACNDLMASATNCHACFEEIKGKPGTMSGSVVDWVRFVEKQKDEDIELTPGGTVTDCVGGPCGCKEGAHE